MGLSRLESGQSTVAGLLPLAPWQEELLGNHHMTILAEACLMVALKKCSELISIPPGRRLAASFLRNKVIPPGMTKSGADQSFEAVLEANLAGIDLDDQIRFRHALKQA